MSGRSGRRERRLALWLEVRHRAPQPVVLVPVCARVSRRGHSAQLRGRRVLFGRVRVQNEQKVQASHQANGVGESDACGRFLCAVVRIWPVHIELVEFQCVALDSELGVRRDHVQLVDTSVRCVVLSEHSSSPHVIENIVVVLSRGRQLQQSRGEDRSSFH